MVFLLPALNGHAHKTCNMSAIREDMTAEDALETRREQVLGYGQ